MFRRPEKKSSNLEVRLSHSKKEAFMQACEENGVTASHAVRTFIDAYLLQSRTMKLKFIAKEIAMTFIKNPIKISIGFGGVASCALALSAVFAAPGVAASSDQPIEPPIPVYPVALAVEGVGAQCEAVFDVSETGIVETGIRASCTHPGFEASVVSAVSMLRFEPKLVDGEPVRRVGIVYPIYYEISANDTEKP